MKRFLMTPEGKQELEQEVKQLVEVERLQIIKDIEEARAHGDISENSEYEDAKERQAMCEGRIQDIKSKLSLSQVVVAAHHKPGPDEEQVVIFGCRVLVEDEDGNEFNYKIVGVDEADVKKNKISYESPLGKALIGSSLDEDVKFVAPNGEREFTILEIHYD